MADFHDKKKSRRRKIFQGIIDFHIKIVWRMKWQHRKMEWKRSRVMTCICVYIPIDRRRIKIQAKKINTTDDDDTASTMMTKIQWNGSSLSLQTYHLCTCSSAEDVRSRKWQPSYRIDIDRMTHGQSKSEKCGMFNVGQQNEDNIIILLNDISENASKRSNISNVQFRYFAFINVAVARCGLAAGNISKIYWWFWPKYELTDSTIYVPMNIGPSLHPFQWRK